MCGIWGYVSRDGGPPDMGLLDRIAASNERRGHHAFGFSWIDAKGRIKMFKQTGRITDRKGILMIARDALMLIGHCRHATHGRADDATNAHPHPCDGGWYVHNGVIRDYLRVYARYRVEPRTDCDSEVLGHLIERRSGPALDRCVRAVRELAPGPLALAALWPRPARLVLVRRGGQPLHAGGVEGGSYFASLPDELPGRVMAVPDDGGLCAGPRGVTHARL